MKKVAKRTAQRHCVPYKLILMDINMPVMDGYAATRDIRKHVGSGDTMIVGTSAYSRAEIEGRGLEAGMNDFLGKPVCPLELVSILRQATLRSRI